MFDKARASAGHHLECSTTFQLDIQVDETYRITLMTCYSGLDRLLESWLRIMNIFPFIGCTQADRLNFTWITGQTCRRANGLQSHQRVACRSESPKIFPTICFQDYSVLYGITMAMVKPVTIYPPFAFRLLSSLNLTSITSVAYRSRWVGWRGELLWRLGETDRHGHLRENSGIDGQEVIWETLEGENERAYNIEQYQILSLQRIVGHESGVL